MDDTQKRLYIGIGICTRCMLEKYTPPRKTFQTATKRNLRSSLAELGEWIAPLPNCKGRCPQNWTAEIALSAINPQKWDGRYFASGKGKSASTGIVIEERQDGWLVAEWELPTHKGGKTYGRFHLNGNIRLVKRNITTHKTWARARDEYDHRKRV